MSNRVPRYWRMKQAFYQVNDDNNCDSVVNRPEVFPKHSRESENDESRAVISDEQRIGQSAVA